MTHTSFSSQRATTHRAFTLIELLVAVSIIGLLSSLVLASVNKARDDAKTKAALQFAAQNDRIMGADAVGMWNFEEGSGTTVRDASGWGRDATLFGGVTFSTSTYHSALSRYALSFNGTSGRVDTTYGLGINPTIQPLTISLWAYPTGTGNRAVFGSSAASNQRLYVGIQSGLWDMGIQGSPWGSGLGRVSVEYSKWSHITLVANGSGARLYINGRFTFQKSYTSYSLASDIDLGNLRSGTFWWAGRIDDVRIYARSLTAQEVKEQYLAGVEKLYANGAIDEEEYQARLVAIANERVEE